MHNQRYTILSYELVVPKQTGRKEEEGGGKKGRNVNTYGKTAFLLSQPSSSYLSVLIPTNP